MGNFQFRDVMTDLSHVPSSYIGEFLGEKERDGAMALIPLYTGWPSGAKHLYGQ